MTDRERMMHIGENERDIREREGGGRGRVIYIEERRKDGERYRQDCMKDRKTQGEMSQTGRERCIEESIRMAE